jgi:hypothetical protein
MRLIRREATREKGRKGEDGLREFVAGSGICCWG